MHIFGTTSDGCAQAQHLAICGRRLSFRKQQALDNGRTFQFDMDGVFSCIWTGSAQYGLDRHHHVFVSVSSRRANHAQVIKANHSGDPHPHPDRDLDLESISCLSLGAKFPLTFLNASPFSFPQRSGCLTQSIQIF